MWMALFKTILCVTPLLAADSATYFPLQTGNRWEYRCTGECARATFVREVVSSERLQPDRPLYYVMREFDVEYRVRMDDQGRLLVLDPATGAERPWYAFGSREGEDYETSIHMCNPVAQITARSIPFHGPSGDFSDTLRITYTNTCNFAGLVEETFVPGLGLVQRIENAGSARYDLTRARVNGLSFILGKNLAFAITLDRAVYTALEQRGTASEMEAKLSLRNTTGEAVSLFFPTAQRQDFIIRNAQGDAVLRWSDGRAFVQVTGTERFEGEAEYGATISLILKSGEMLPEGKYTIQGWLTSNPAQFSAIASFEIRR